MSLVSTTPAAASVVNPIVHDSGWKTVTGNGAETDLETLSYSIDTIVHIYAKAYKATDASYYKAKGVYTNTSANTSNTLSIVWRHINDKSQNLTSGNFTFNSVYEMGTDPTTYLTNHSSAARNSLGVPLEKDTTFVFHQTSSANSSTYGIQYRVIVERSDGEQMVKWATNA
tara:strand:+ start:543 stop:1055 length:513 start_codon:yes stop_codon:yes gene_type:complete